MPSPSFLGPGTTIDLTALALAPAASALGGAPGSQALSFVIQAQLQTNWCWAAVSASVSHFYLASSIWTQCTVADQALPRTDCCGSGASDPQKCNTPWYLDRALNVTGNLANMLQSNVTFTDIQNEIRAGAPVGCRVGWFGGGGHFLTITGWVVGATGTEYIELADPIYLNSQIPYNDFAASYQSGGDWTHTYLTQSAPAVVAAGGGAMANMQIADPAAIGA